MKSTTVLLILDGWGHRAETDFNAIHHANTPTWDRLWQHYPHTLLECSGKHVGLPTGQMGNSEVGHMTMGAGRVVYQELSRIDQSISEGSLQCIPVFESLADPVAGQAVHVIGLLSPGGVHSHENHIFSVVKLLLAKGREVVLHAILDGRDTPPKSAEKSLAKAQKLVDTYDGFSIASISGRYYAMDRDLRWERTAQAYEAVTQGTAPYHAKDPLDALFRAYSRGESDEFVAPTIIEDTHHLRDGDDCLFMNFRSDRARQLSRALVVDEGDIGFVRRVRPKIRYFVTVTPYADDIDAGGSCVEQVDCLFRPEVIKDSFGEVVANAGLRQLRIAETEKYAHVTYFFSGGREAEYLGETRHLLPSPKVATYDLQPEMSALSVTEVVVNAIADSKFDTIICNFANADMVGHTGNFQAAIKAVECLDGCLDLITKTCQSTESHCVITADHGNVEQMLDADNAQVHTAHTLGLVPCIYVGPNSVQLRTEGGLEDVAPTLLDLMQIPKPNAMQGQSLLR